jgi:hypothetical protein
MGQNCGGLEKDNVEEFYSLPREGRAVAAAL